MSQTATYCPEDDKLRLYVGRVPREEYEALRAAGWQALHKQRETGGGDFASVWTPSREDTALKYSDGIIDDEDMGPQERAADRAERFAGYRDRREGESLQFADGYDAGPHIHGHQSAALAERRANQHDKLATRAVNAWDKAEYWQRRTAGIIGHALHVSAPGVRMGRIKTIEAELRRTEKTQAEAAARWQAWEKVLTLPDLPESSAAWDAAHNIANYSGGCDGYKHPEPDQVSAYVRENGTSLWSLLTNENGRRLTGHEAARMYLNRWKRPDDPGNSINRWINHLRLRLAYENQMLEAQGGRLAAMDIEPGGWLGKRQVEQVHKSPATGRVTSVKVRVPRVSGWQYQVANVPGTDYALLTIETERLPPDAYRPPSEEERAEFLAARKAEKAGRAVVPIINPTRAEADRLQSQWNTEAAESDKARNYPRKAGEVEEMTAAEYAGLYKDSRGLREYRGIKVRVHGRYGSQRVNSVVMLTDKPQKQFPASVWVDAKPETEPEQKTSGEIPAAVVGVRKDLVLA